MGMEPLAVEGAWRVTQRVFGDARGAFLEWFKADELEQVTGRRFDLRQANLSVSAAGVLRGVHFADVPPGQAKYVTCVRGAVLEGDRTEDAGQPPLVLVLGVAAL